MMKISHPVPDKSNRYIKFRNEIEKFRQNYLSNTAFDFIQIAQKWNETEPEMLNTSSFGKLQFGEGEDAEPKFGMKKFGPKEIMKDEVVFFFIMHQNDTPVAYTINDYLSGNHPDFQVGLSGFLHLQAIPPFRLYYFQLLLCQHSLPRRKHRKSSQRG